MVTREEKNKEIQEEIEEEHRSELRKKIVKRFLLITFFLISTFLILYGYSKYSTSIGLVVKEKRIINERIPNSFNGIKIVQFSDLDYGVTSHSDELNNLVKTINIRKPDIVVFTGNLINKDYKLNTKEKEFIIKKLQSINAPIGKYAVEGKYDDEDSFSTIMNQSDFNILNNSYDLIYNNESILMVGLSSYVKDDRDIDEAFKYFKEETHNSNIYTISIMSETEDLDEIITNYNPDLILAGNSLNGEIRLPLIGGLIKQEGSSKYTDEYYKVSTTSIYISSGIASPTIGFRIGNSPSINLFRLSNKK